MLAQAGVLTPFQAAQINAGRGESLARVLTCCCTRLHHPIMRPVLPLVLAAASEWCGCMWLNESSPAATSAGIAEWLERSKLLPSAVTGRR